MKAIDTSIRKIVTDSADFAETSPEPALTNCIPTFWWSNINGD